VELHWSVEQARLYQLWAVRLHREAYPPGESGIRACFHDLGGIQLDPLPVLGRNHDLVIQARVAGTRPDDTLDLVHRERLGFEYWDKVLCVIDIEAFQAFRGFMAAGGEAWEKRREARLAVEHPGAVEAVYAAVLAHGPLSSRELKDLEVAQGDARGWKSTKAANAALEGLWNRGELTVFRRVNYRRYFDLTERVIPTEHYDGDPLPPEEFYRYLLLRRVRAVGLLPASGDAEAWAFLRAARSSGLPERLVAKDELALVRVDRMKTPFYALPPAEEGLVRAERLPLLDEVRFIAPLDPLLWARGSLARLWDFEYAWEVYKPSGKRRFGYYVLPILYQDRFVGRFDARYDRATGTLVVLAYYAEPGGLELSHPKTFGGMQRFLDYLGGERTLLPDGEHWDKEAV
jgi:hypothetical protein